MAATFFANEVVLKSWIDEGVGGGKTIPTSSMWKSPLSSSLSGCNVNEKQGNAWNPFEILGWNLTVIAMWI